MAKKGMHRSNEAHLQPRNVSAPVPELQGKAKSGKEKARPIMAGTAGSDQKLFHTEKPIPSDVYPVLDTDLARDNLENDLPAADQNEL